jgi:hypothetical protein
MFLMATGLLNLLVGIACLFGGAAISRFPPDKLEEQIAKEQPKQWEQLKEAGWTAEDLVRVYSRGGYGFGTAVVLASLLSIVGGICMLTQRAYGLAMFASLVTAVPCLSPMSCPCLFGMMIGIWSATVLLNADVRALFR